MIALCDEIAALGHEGKAVDVVYLDFSKGFNVVSHNIFIDKLKHWLDKWIVRRTEN